MWLLVNSQLKAKGFQNTKKAKPMVSKPFLRGHLRNDHDIDKPLLTLNQSEMYSAASPIVIQKEWGCGGTIIHFLQRFCISDKNEDSLGKKNYYLQYLHSVLFTVWQERGQLKI